MKKASAIVEDLEKEIVQLSKERYKLHKEKEEQRQRLIEANNNELFRRRKAEAKVAEFEKIPGLMDLATERDKYKAGMADAQNRLKVLREAYAKKCEEDREWDALREDRDMFANRCEALRDEAGDLRSEIRDQRRKLQGHINTIKRLRIELATTKGTNLYERIEELARDLRLAVQTGEEKIDERDNVIQTLLDQMAMMERINNPTPIYYVPPASHFYCRCHEPLTKEEVDEALDPLFDHLKEELEEMEPKTIQIDASNMIAPEDINPGDTIEILIHPGVNVAVRNTNGAFNRLTDWRQL